MQYRLTTMRANWQQVVTRVLLALAVLLASVSTASLASPAAGHSTIHLTARGTLPGIEPAVLRDRVAALNQAVERPDRSGRLLPVLIGMLVAVLAAGIGLRRRRLWSDPVSVRSQTWPPSSKLARRPASSRPDRCPAPVPTGVG
jgi:hypothetical protein